MDGKDALRIRRALDGADLVLMGASNGLDMAEGLNIFADDDHFRTAYGDLAARDGARCILQGLCSPTPQARWRWGARFAQREWAGYEPGPLMRTLRELTGGTDTFAITCNLDGHLVKAGFDEGRMLETEGNMRELVCSTGCTDERLPAGEPDEDLIPRCPHCGAPLSFALDERRLAHSDAQAAERLAELNRLLCRHRDGRAVILELGVGLRNGVIKRMLAQAAGALSHVTYIVFNFSQSIAPGVAHEEILVEGDMAAAFEEIAACRP